MSLIHNEDRHRVTNCLWISEYVSTNECAAYSHRQDCVKVDTIDSYTQFCEARRLWYTDHSDNIVPSGSPLVRSLKHALRDAVGADLDGDDDIDVVLCDWFYGIYWFKNTDGAGTFSAIKAIDEDIYQCSDIKTGDLDGDGDVDVVATSDADDRITWYENDGELLVLSWPHLCGLS